jgi:hypothetical protein
MRICTGDCVIHFTRFDLRTEDDTWEGFTEPEEFADTVARDLQMAISRQVPRWKDLPGYGDTSITVWLDDIVESGDLWEDREFAATLGVLIKYPENADIVPVVAAAVEEVTGSKLDLGDPTDPEAGSDGYGDFES